jgi:hypothetical protein
MSRSAPGTYKGSSPTAKALAAFKKESKLTYRQIQKLAQVDYTMLVAIGQGAVVPIPTLKRLAKFFQWTPVELGEAAAFEGDRKKKK